MLKITLFAAVATAALLAHFVPGWITSTSQAQIEAASIPAVDPTRMMMNAPHDLPTEEFTDYTFVFEHPSSK